MSEGRGAQVWDKEPLSWLGCEQQSLWGGSDSPANPSEGRAHLHEHCGRRQCEQSHPYTSPVPFPRGCIWDRAFPVQGKGSSQGLPWFLLEHGAAWSARTASTEQ